MSVKKIVLLITLVTNICIFSQTEKGKFLIGGSTNFGSSYLSEGNDGLTTRSSNLVFSANAGYSIIDNLFVGLNIQFLSNNFKVDFLNSENKTTETTFAPFLKYYFLKEKFRPFALIRYGFGKSTYKNLSSNNAYESNSDVTKLNLGGGFSYFFTDYLSLELEAFYQRDTNSTTIQSDDFKFYGFGTSLGFSIFL